MALCFCWTLVSCCHIILCASVKRICCERDLNCVILPHWESLSLLFFWNIKISSFLLLIRFWSWKDLYHFDVLKIKHHTRTCTNTGYMSKFCNTLICSRAPYPGTKIVSRYRQANKPIKFCHKKSKIYEIVWFR